MELLIFSFVAGALTVLAPCVLSLLPIIVGGSISGSSWHKPFVVTGSLVVSIIIFTLLLKFGTTLLGVPPQVWEAFSGVIIILLGLTMLFPGVWERLTPHLNSGAGKLLGTAGKKRGVWGEVLTGLALGPVFSSCSPTYAYILAGVLPATFGLGLLYLLAYALGLALVLLLVALVGQQLVNKLQWASNPHGWFKRFIGILFIRSEEHTSELQSRLH